MDAEALDDATVTGRIAAAIAELGADRRRGAALLGADLVVRVATTDRGDVCTLVLGPDAVTVRAGALSDRAPDVILEGTGDVLHAVFSGERDAGQALGHGDLVATGPVNEILRTLVVLPPVFPLYRRAVRAAETATDDARLASSA